MASPFPATSVLRTIDENYKKFVSDPDYAKGMKALDHKTLREATEGLKEKIASFINFYVFRRHLRSVKVAKGSLAEEAEKALVARGRDALKTFDEISSSIAAIGKLMAESGLETVVDRHMESLCQHLNYNPKVLAMLHELKDMGISDGDSSVVLEELRKKNYNLLRYGTSNGTFASFVEFVASLKGPLANEQKLTEQHGLPTLQGASGGCDAYCQAGIAIVIAGGLCLITAFYGA